MKSESSSSTESHAAIPLPYGGPIVEKKGSGGVYDTGGPGPEIMAASSLEGDSVFSPRHEKLGKISELMIDVRRGQIAYAVLSCGGLLGVGDKLFAIPWSALTLDADEKCFVLDVEKSHLQAAPGFDKDHWPSMADAQWAMNVYSHFGRAPYWSP